MSERCHLGYVQSMKRWPNVEATGLQWWLAVGIAPDTNVDTDVT